MDPFTISTGITGFLSLTIEIGTAIGKYISGVKSAEKEAHDLLTEFQALQRILEQLVRFLQGDEAKNVSSDDSYAFSMISSCQSNVEYLHKKLVQLEKPNHGGKLDYLWQRGTWPFQKDECQQLVNTLHRFAQMFEFSLLISNWFASVPVHLSITLYICLSIILPNSNVLANTSAIGEVLEKLEKSKGDNLSVSEREELLRMSKQIPGILSFIKEVSKSNTKMQYSTMNALQGVRKQLGGRC